jgi:hypothetical protein
LRGRVQVFWNCSNQTRAEIQRDWLNLQLQGRGYISEAIPRATFLDGVWRTMADVGFNTTTEGDVVKALCLTRMSADPFITSGSWVKFHHCPHDDDDSNTCSSTLQTTVKP